jgi:hypothetical protein
MELFELLLVLVLSRRPDGHPKRHNTNVVGFYPMSHTTNTNPGAPVASSDQAALYPLTIKPHANDWWKPPFRFLVESITGVFLFGVVAAAAVV